MSGFSINPVALFVAVLVPTMAFGQDWDDSARFGSYESILARANGIDIDFEDQGSSNRSSTSPSVPPAPPKPSAPASTKQHHQGSTNHGSNHRGDGSDSRSAPAYQGDFHAPPASFNQDAGKSVVCEGGCDPVFGEAVATPSQPLHGTTFFDSDLPVQNSGGQNFFDFAGCNTCDDQWTASLFGVSLRRDFEDSRLLGDVDNTHFFSDSLENGELNGIGVTIARRRSNGSGVEATYWGLSESDTLVITGAQTTTALRFFEDLGIGAANVAGIFDSGTEVQLTRDTEINNFELNLLRNGGQYTTRTGRQAAFELLGGFRLFTFDESFRYFTNGTPGAEYLLEAENSLTGFQIGARNEVCLSNRFRLTHSATFGLFNNFIRTRQRVFDETGATATVAPAAIPIGGAPFDVTDTKNDAATLGQFDIGLVYQASQQLRFNIGYRVIGVAGVALAVDQIPDNDILNSGVPAIPPELPTSAQSNGNLLLHGVFFGSEYAF